MGPKSKIERRWYADLVRPVLPAVSAAVGQVARPGADPWSMPRTGLGGAIVLHVARDFGTRRRRRVRKLAVLAIEAWNQRVFGGLPDASQRSAWLERDLARLAQVWGTLLRKEAGLVSRVLGRLLAEGAFLADFRVPEAVLFLRGAVAAGVLAGDVPDDLHGRLDRLMTWTGLAWEAAQGSVDGDGWRGALHGIGDPIELPEAPAEVALTQARQTLEMLPRCRARRLLGGILDRIDDEGAGRRHPAAWTPLLAPEPAPKRHQPWAGRSELGAFQHRWREPIEQTLAAQTSGSSEALARAVGYLSGQGGKRARAVMVLAAAQACGGHPQRALPAAGAVEWLHQASLILDDMIDEAALRRGGVTLHQATSIPFAAGVAGFVFARIHEALRGMHPAIRDRLVEAAVALADGEQQELRRTGDLTLDLTGYYRVIEGKTARLFACAAAAGALSVEASSARVKALTRYGREAGLAFQIIDDLLDYTGDIDVLGKQPGTDLRESKVTLPALMLLEALPPSDRLELCGLLLDDGGPDTLPRVRRWLVRHGVIELCMARAHEHLERAIGALQGLPDAHGRQLLTELATRMVERRR